MSIFPLPRKVDQIQRIFFHFHCQFFFVERKSHFVKWSPVCLDKRKEALTQMKMSSLNKALYCKWIWRFANKKGVLWIDVIKAKYGEEEGG